MGDHKNNNHSYMGEFEHFDNEINLEDFFYHQPEIEAPAIQKEDSYMKLGDHLNVNSYDFYDVENHNDLNNDSNYNKIRDNELSSVVNNQKNIIVAEDKTNSFSVIVNNEKPNNSQELNKEENSNTNQYILNQISQMTEEITISNDKKSSPNEVRIKILEEIIPNEEEKSEISNQNNMLSLIDLIGLNESDFSQSNKKFNNGVSQLNSDAQFSPVNFLKEYDLSKYQQSQFHPAELRYIHVVSPISIDIRRFESDQNLLTPFSEESEEKMIKKNDLVNQIYLNEPNMIQEDDEKFYEELSHKYLLEFMEQIVQDYLDHNNLQCNENNINQMELSALYDTMIMELIHDIEEATLKDSFEKESNSIKILKDSEIKSETHNYTEAIDTSELIKVFLFNV